MKRTLCVLLTLIMICGVFSAAMISAGAYNPYQKYADRFNAQYNRINEELKKEAEDKATADTSVEAKSFANDNGSFKVNSPLPDSEYKAGTEIELAVTSSETYAYRYYGGQRVTSPDTVKMTILKDGSVKKEFVVKISDKDLGVKFSDAYSADEAGTYLVNIKYNGDNCGSYNFTVSDSSPNTMKVKSAAKSIKASALKKSKKTVKPLTITNAQGNLSVTKEKSGTTASIFKKITVNKKTGAITFKKGKYAKKTYSIKLKITAEGDSAHDTKAITKKVKIKIK